MDERIANGVHCNRQLWWIPIAVHLAGKSIRISYYSMMVFILVMISNKIHSMQIA